MELKSFILFWNVTYKFDREYRKKHNVRFGSKEHRELHPFDMIMDLQEDKFIDTLIEERIRKRENEKDYKKTGNFLYESGEQEEDISEYYDDLDLSKFDG